jgi:hypothetical protein
MLRAPVTSHGARIGQGACKVISQLCPVSVYQCHTRAFMTTFQHRRIYKPRALRLSAARRDQPLLYVARWMQLMHAISEFGKDYQEMKSRTRPSTAAAARQDEGTGSSDEVRRAPIGTLPTASIDES